AWEPGVVAAAASTTEAARAIFTVGVIQILLLHPLLYCSGRRRACPAPRANKPTRNFFRGRTAERNISWLDGRTRNGRSEAAQCRGSNARLRGRREFRRSRART